MGRPSKKAERQEQILDAFGRVVAVWGLEGATQDRVAEEASLARALIRHNLGNQEEVESAFIDRYLGQSGQILDAMKDCLSEPEPMATLLDWLFDPEYLDPEFTRISEALLRACGRNEGLNKRMHQWLGHMHTGIEHLITSAKPAADPGRAHDVAIGITALWFNADSLNSLGVMPDHLRASKNAAKILIGSL